MLDFACFVCCGIFVTWAWLALVAMQHADYKVVSFWYAGLFALKLWGQALWQLAMLPMRLTRWILA